MKNQSKIIGQKIVKIAHYDEYIVATLENGYEIEISSIDKSESLEDKEWVESYE